MPSDLDPITYKLGETISVDRRLSDLVGVEDIDPSSQYTLMGRLSSSSVVAFSKSMDVDVQANTISCDVTSSEVASVGAYKLWIRVASGGSYYDVQEFDLSASDHAMGHEAIVGAIYMAARGLSPVAWRALRGFDEYGDDQLQRSIELAKLRVLHVIITVGAEAMLDPRVVDYVAKRCLVDSVLPAAVDFWTDQLVTQTALGNSTSVRTYPDRIKAVQEQIKLFQAALADQLDEVIAIIGPVSAPGPSPMIIQPAALVTPTLDDVVIEMHRPHRGSPVDIWWLS